jgi:hypothetical protein
MSNRNAIVGGSGWRAAKSLIVLYDQVVAAAPHRTKTSDDATIGDAAHAARTSDHNKNSADVVCALDLTHDPAGGFNSYVFAELLRQAQDERVKYIISNSRICYGPRSPSRASKPNTWWKWEPYDGDNPHDKHVHISVGDSRYYDKETPWAFTLPEQAPPIDKPQLKRGSTGDDVRELQHILFVDGFYGPTTENAVKSFQRTHGLSADGIVGPDTWAALLQPDLGVSSGKGSWFSQYQGQYTWKDSGDEPNSNKLGVPDDEQGIAFYSQATLGKWFDVTAPNGKTLRLQQTDIGPHPSTGRKIDIAAVAAERFGYTPANFPTDQIFTWTPAEEVVATKELVATMPGPINLVEKKAVGSEALVEVKSPFASKVNWVAAATSLLALFAAFGLEIPEAYQNMILGVLPTIGSIAVVILRTWFSTTVLSTSLPDKT